GGLDEKGNIVAWRQRIVGQSILAGTAFEGMMVKNGIDETSVEGASTLPYRAALELAASEGNWGQPLAEGRRGERRGRGIAVHESFSTVVAQVAEVTVRPDGGVRVDRVVCAVDCGVAVNPDVVRAQMESGIAYGLTAALHGAVTLKDGLVEQSNFHDYRPLRINEMPRVGVYIVRSAEKPTGVGEPATPVIAPAVANAVFAATGKPLRSLPMRLEA